MHANCLALHGNAKKNMLFTMITWSFPVAVHIVYFGNCQKMVPDWHCVCGGPCGGHEVHSNEIQLKYILKFLETLLIAWLVQIYICRSVLQDSFRNNERTLKAKGSFIFSFHMGWKAIWCLFSHGTGYIPFFVPCLTVLSSFARFMQQKMPNCL